MHSITKRFADYLGIGAGTLCLVHCLALPLVLMLFSSPAFISVGFAENFFILLACLAALYTGIHTQFLGVRVFLSMGVFLFIVGSILPVHIALTGALHIMASMAVAFGHILNLRYLFKSVRQGALSCSNAA